MRLEDLLARQILELGLKPTNFLRALPPAAHCLQKKGSKGSEHTSATLLKSKNREIQLLPSHPLPQLCGFFLRNKVALAK